MEQAPGFRVGYLLNQYPALSHTFILREVQALRRIGADLRTFSIHRSDPDHLLAEADQDAFRSTYALRPAKVRRLLAAHATVLRGHPAAYRRALRRALACGRLSPEALLWQLFYFVEAVPLWVEMHRQGVRYVHAHFTTPAADVAMIIAELGDGRSPWRWSFSAHGPDIDDADQRKLAVKVRRATAVACISHFARSQLMTLVGPEHWEKLHVVRCGLESRAVAHRVSATNGRTPTRLLAVGRLIPYKAHHLLLDAVHRLRQQDVPVVLTLVGDGPLRKQLVEAAESLGISDCTEFAGSVGQDHIRAYYADADIFCLSSLREGIPVVLMEAMAHGIPVIAPQIMGIPELVEHRRTGLLVRPGSAEALADAIVLLRSDPSLRHRLATEAYERLSSEYDVDRSAETLLRMFSSGANQTSSIVPARDD